MLSKSIPFYFNDLSGNGKYYPVEDDHKPFLNQSIFYFLNFFSNFYLFLTKILALFINTNILKKCPLIIALGLLF